jgi:hypothetical protein
LPASGALIIRIPIHPTKISSACCFVVLCTTYGADAKGMRMSPALLDTYRAVIQQNCAAEATLFSQMENVAKTIDTFLDRDGRFPEEPSELQQSLRKTLGPNPYRPEPNNVPAVKLLSDTFLAPETINDFIASNVSNSVEEPGTITTVTNGRDMFIIWACGSDRRPIRDSSGKPRVLITSFHPSH